MNRPNPSFTEKPAAEQTFNPKYAELHCITNYSFLRGASHPEELVQQAAALGYQALAITDECSMAGIVKAHNKAKDCGLKLITGSEFTLEEDIKIVMLARNRTGYGQICSLISRARRRADKGYYTLWLKDLQTATDQIIIIWLPATDQDKNRAYGNTLKAWFPDRLWLGLEIFLDGQDLKTNQRILDLAKDISLPMLACGDVHMHNPDRKPLLDTLTAIKLGVSIKMAGRLLQKNNEKHLRTISAIQRLYPPSLLENTLTIINQCHFSLDELRYEYPEELVPEGKTATQYLLQLTRAGALKRWPGGVQATVQLQIDKELQLIASLHYEYYFLTVFDIVQFAKNQGILCQGRGSAANSAVCYCLGITEVNPAKINLLFERFISKERNEPPDIDVDFEHERREEVIQYIYKKYGRHRAALAATVITYRPKSAIRDVGKAMGLDTHLIDKLAKTVSWWDKKTSLLERFEEAGISSRNRVVNQFAELIQQILGFPRHLSQHVGGFIISSGPLSQLVPLENAAMPERTIIQWDKDDLEALGLLKIDILALGMLSSIRKSLDLINQQQGATLTLADIPAEDPLTYQMLQQGDSIGVFQVESRAQIAMLPRLKPTKFYDLVIQVAIVRPGPIQGKMVHPYLKRRNGDEAVSYANDAVKAVLERTLGVPIFQEQVIKLAVVAAGFTPGEADQLRRAMAAWKRKGGLEHFQNKLINGMLERGHDQRFAERIFEQIKGFGDYGFPESHAASFALLVYFSAWLKCHHPAAFYCGLLNSQPMGFYSPSQLVQDASRHHIEVRPVDVLHSHWDCSLEYAKKTALRPGIQRHAGQPAIRLGLERIKGLRATTALRIVEARKIHTIKNLSDMAAKALLDQGEMSRLIEAGAFKSLSGNRYQSHWQATGIIPRPPLLEASLVTERQDHVNLKAPPEADDLRADYESLGLSLGRHPMAILREQENKLKYCKKASELALIQHGRFVQVAGLVTGRQRPSTATGVIFLTLEDETNNINIVIWSNMLERFRAAVLRGRLLKIKGIIERQASVIHVVAGTIQDCSGLLENFSLKSRDFH